MTTIKFDKSVKYQGVRYAAHEAFKVADEDVDELKKTGATVLSVDNATPTPADDGKEDEEQKDDEDGEEQKDDEDVDELKNKLLEYTVPELTKFAEERGIDLQKKTKKAEIYNIIVAALN